MEPLNICVDSWIIRDGNYGDFTVGQEARFALEFYPYSLKPSGCRTPSATLLRASRYRVCARVAFTAEGVWVLDMGFLAYQESEPPGYGEKDSWVEGEISLGIDPFMYFERLKNLPGMTQLAYDFRIEEILLETTPWVEETGGSGGATLVRDEREESFRRVAATDAWNDDGGRASYILKCLPTNARKS